MTVSWLERPFTLRERLVLGAEILVVYVQARWWLRRDGVETTVERLRSRGAAPGGAADSLASYTAVARLGGVVQRTLAPLPSDTRCLARSLALTGLLARRGLRSTLVIGVSPGPDFKAHAWVEHWERPALPAGNGEYARLLEL
jgi:Transglutaminase-like superfamily